jgi:hypothetical protein
MLQDDSAKDLAPADCRVDLASAVGLVAGG